MNLDEEYIVLDLKALFFYALRQWKLIVVAGVIAAVLLGSFQAFNEYNAGLNPEENDAYNEYRQYYDQLALYEDQITATQAKIDNLQDYMDHSVLMSADHRNIYMAKAIYYIDSGYQIMTEHTYQNPNKTSTLTWYYQNYLTDYSMYEEIGAEAGMEAKYLMELVDVSTTNGETLTITVKHTDEASARFIMNTMKEKLEGVRQHLDASVHDHTLTLMMDTMGIYVDESVQNIQERTNDEMLGYQKDLIQHKKDLYALEENGGTGEPNVVTAFIKWFVIGGVAGAVLVAGCLLLAALFGNRIHAPEQLVSLHRLPVFGELLVGQAKSDPITRLFDKWEGRLTQKSDANLQFVAANIKHHCADAKRVLVCSDQNPQFSQEIAEVVSSYLPEIQFTAAGSLLKEAQSLQMLRECDTVVMLVSRDRTRSKTIGNAVRLLREGGKSAAGFIFVY